MSTRQEQPGFNHPQDTATYHGSDAEYQQRHYGTGPHNVGSEPGDEDGLRRQRTTAQQQHQGYDRRPQRVVVEQRKPGGYKKYLYAVLAGAAFVAASKMTGIVEFKSHGDVTVEHIDASLLSAETIDEECRFGYENIINAKAGMELKDDSSVFGWNPPEPGFMTAKWWQTMTDARFTNKVCNEASSTHLENTADGKYDVVFEDGFSYNVMTIQSDPMQNIYTGDHNYLAGNAGAIESLLKGWNLPDSLTPDKIENFEEALRGILYVMATTVSAKACGSKALEVLRIQLATEIAHSWAERLRTKAALNGTQSDVKDSDVLVTVPTDTSFEGQYDELLKTLQQKTEDDGMTFTVPDPTKIPCDTESLTTPGATS